VLVVPAAVSVTVAVQVVAWPITTVDGLHATVVVVVLRFTVTVVDPLLVA
jgi:Na+/H+ antiporter NhaA